MIKYNKKPRNYVVILGRKVHIGDKVTVRNGFYKGEHVVIQVETDITKADYPVYIQTDPKRIVMNGWPHVRSISGVTINDVTTFAELPSDPKKSAKKLEEDIFIMHLGEEVHIGDFVYVDPSNLTYEGPTGYVEVLEINLKGYWANNPFCCGDGIQESGNPPLNSITQVYTYENRRIT